MLGVGRVNKPGNLVWLKMARSTKATSSKKVEPAWLGLGLVPRCLGIGPLYSLPWFSWSVFCVCCAGRSGEYKFWAVFGVDPSPPLVAPRIGSRVQGFGVHPTP